MKSALLAAVVTGAMLAGGCAGGGGGSMGGAATGDPDASAPKGSIAYDRGVFSTLLEKHERITRTFREIDGGIEATTESDDPKVAALIVDHVEAMKARIESGRRIRQWDPIYVAIFDAGNKIKLEIERTGKGVRVRETSSDPEVAELIRRHALVVDAFVANGVEESAKEHPAR
jgi:hypothetical protein